MYHRFISGLNGFILFYSIGIINNIYVLRLVGINAILYHIFNPKNKLIRFYDIIFNIITILFIIYNYNIPNISYIYTVLAIYNWIRHKYKRILVFNYNFYTKQLIHSYMVQLPLFLAISNILY